MLLVCRSCVMEKTITERWAVRTMKIEWNFTVLRLLRAKIPQRDLRKVIFKLTLDVCMACCFNGCLSCVSCYFAELVYRHEKLTRKVRKRIKR